MHRYSLQDCPAFEISILHISYGSGKTTSHFSLVEMTWITFLVGILLQNPVVTVSDSPIILLPVPDPASSFT